MRTEFKEDHMRLFAKKSFAFRNPDAPVGDFQTPEHKNGEVEFVTTPLTFHDAPEWVADDKTFKIAVDAGEIETFTGKKSIKAKEKQLADSQ